MRLSAPPVVGGVSRASITLFERRDFGGQSITLTANVQASLEHLTSPAGGVGDINDDTHTASLAATYAVARNWQLGCNLARLTRGVSGGINYDYTANTVNCSAQVKLQ